MDENTKHALKKHRAQFQMFARNGRWGTCNDCPRDFMDNVYPEFCKNTERYDHQLSLTELAEQYQYSLDTQY